MNLLKNKINWRQPPPFIFLFGVLLFIYLVPFPVFWIDESMAVLFTFKSNSEIVNNLLTIGAHPPLYYFILKLIRIISNDKEIYYRLFSSAAYFLTGYYIYLFAKNSYGRRIANLSLIVWASNFFLLFYSKQARPYSFLALLSIASTYYFYKLSENFKWRYALGYLVTTISGLYTGYWFVFIFLTQFIYFLFFLKKNVRLILLQILSGLAFLPWAILYLLKFNNYQAGEFIERANLSILKESFAYFVVGQWWLLLVIIIVGIISNLKNGGFNFKKIALPVFMIILPIIFAFFVSQFVPVYTPGRREIVVIPFFVLLIGYLIALLDNKKWQVGISLLLVLFAFQNIQARNDYIHNWKDNDLTLINRALASADRNDLFILYGLSNASFNYFTYKDDRFLNVDKFYFPSGMEVQPDSLAPIEVLKNNPDDLEEELNQLISKLSNIDKDRIYLFVYSDEISPRLVSTLDDLYVRAEEYSPRNPHMNSWIDEIILYKKK